MLEVLHTPEGYIWVWIGYDGRVLHKSVETYTTDREAHDAAKAYRDHFQKHSRPIDGQ